MAVARGGASRMMFGFWSTKPEEHVIDLACGTAQSAAHQVSTYHVRPKL